LVPGSTDRSYGIHVARLAGLPPEVLATAERLLRQLESDGIGATSRPGRGARGRGPRYTQALLLPGEGTAPSPVLEELSGVDVDRLSPQEAHRRLGELARRARAASPGDGGPG
jgi:DNA mismatch repair protein MutS